jgi:hypothetical protein
MKGSRLALFGKELGAAALVTPETSSPVLLVRTHSHCLTYGSDPPVSRVEEQGTKGKKKK